MNKDLKIGMLLGLILVVAASFWIATRKKLSVESRMAKHQEPTEKQEDQQTFDQVRYEADLPGNRSFIKKPPIKHLKPDDQLVEWIVHTVAKDETLWNISVKYYGSGSPQNMQKIIDRNNIKDPDKLKAGRKLIIPK